MHDPNTGSLRGPWSFGALACVLLAVAVAILQFPAALLELHDEASRNSALSYADREFAGGNGIVVDQEVLYQARARIPESATYHVKTGTQVVEGATELTVPYVASFVTYFLLPRRQTEHAPWVICYGCNHAELPGRVQTVWKHPAGISIVRLQR